MTLFLQLGFAWLPASGLLLVVTIVFVLCLLVAPDLLILDLSSLTSFRFDSSAEVGRVRRRLPLGPGDASSLPAVLCCERRANFDFWPAAVGCARAQLCYGCVSARRILCVRGIDLLCLLRSASFGTAGACVLPCLFAVCVWCRCG